MKTITIELNDEQWRLLCYTLGIATGGLIKDGQGEQADQVRKLFNHCIKSKKDTEEREEDDRLQAIADQTAAEHRREEGR